MKEFLVHKPREELESPKMEVCRLVVAKHLISQCQVRRVVIRVDWPKPTARRFLGLMWAR